MKTTAIIALLITCAVLGSALYYVSKYDSETPPGPFAPVARVNNSEPINITALIQQNAAYRNKIKELERENQNLLTQLQVLNPTGSAQPNQPHTRPNLESPTDYSHMLAQQQRSAAEAGEFAQYLSGFSGRSSADINRDLNNRFKLERIDHQWANEHERKLSELFIDNENLALFVPETIDCRATRCRVTIPISSYEESNKVMQYVAAALEANSAGLEQTTVVSVPNPSTGFADFYIARSTEVNIFE